MPTPFTQGHALLIGVGADLPNTVDDAVGIADLLLDPTRCAYPKDNVTVLTEADATRSRVLAAFDQLAQRTGPEDTVIVYYSGHGYRVKTGIGAHYFLMPYGYDVSDLTSTAISGNEFVDKLRALKSRKLLLLLDCCHAGGLDDTKIAGVELTKAPMPPEAQSLLAAGQGRIAIASCKADELSLAGKPMSAFTLALAEALCGDGASETDGYVRAADLALHTRQMVPRRTRDRQHPILNFDQADNFIVAYYAAGDTKTKGLPFPVEDIQIEDKPGAFNAATLDQRGQTVHGPQTNITGPVHGPVYSGNIGQIGDRKIDTGGGNYYEKDINVSGGGDFVSGQKIDVRGGFYQPGWKVNTVNQITGGNVDLSQHFQTVYTQIDKRASDPNVDKDELTETVQKIQAEAAKGDDANPSKIERWLKALGDAAPDILEVTAGVLVNPVGGIAEGIRKIAARLRKST